MSSIANIYFGKITSIVDDRSWLVTVDFLNQPSLGSNGPKAMPLGFINTKLEEEDKILLFEINREITSYFYIPLKNDGQVSIKNGDTEINITQEENLIIKSKDKTFLACGGDVYINVNSNFIFNGPGKLQAKGMSAPDQSNPGPFCAIPVCTYTGLQHTGSEVSLMNPAEELPDTSKEK